MASCTAVQLNEGPAAVVTDVSAVWQGRGVTVRQETSEFVVDSCLMLDLVNGSNI